MLTHRGEGGGEAEKGLQIVAIWGVFHRAWQDRFKRLVLQQVPRFIETCQRVTSHHVQ